MKWYISQSGKSGCDTEFEHKIWLHFQLNSLGVVKKKWVIAVVEQPMTGSSKLQLMLIFCSSMNIFIQLMLDELHFCKGSVGQII